MEETATPENTEEKKRARAKRWAKVLKKKRQQINAARDNPSDFIEYCFRNEKTGKVVKNADFHKEWQEFFTKNKWAILISPIEHCKTWQIGIGRTIWEIGKNPNIRILLIGESEPSAKKLLKIIKREITENPRVKEVFPNLVRSSNPEDPWSSTEITVERDRRMKEPTIQARGAKAKSILGSRLDLIIIDDLLNIENTGSKLVRDSLEYWFDTTVYSRIQDYYENGKLVDSGRCYIIGTPWNRDDLLHRLKKRKGWKYLHYSVVKNPKAHPSRWVSLWPESWPLVRILEKRDGSTVTAFARTLLCMVMSDEMRRFKDAWIDHMFRQGVGRTFLSRPPVIVSRKLRCITGVDLGVGKEQKDALTVLFTIAIHPKSQHRIIVDIESGKWTGPEIVQKIQYKNWRYDSFMVVESNQAQKYIAQFASNRGVPTVALWTGKHNKYSEEFGVESLAVEMRAGMWIAPSGKDGDDIDPELTLWREDLENYDPEVHTGDHLMASWFAREGARLFAREMWRNMEHTAR